MSVNLLNNIEMTVYPGVFVPSENTEKIREKLRELPSSSKKKPMVNIINNEQIIKIEVAVPGVSREDFCIEATGNILSVSVLHNEISENDLLFSLHEFDCKFFERHIVLPENADLSFVSAVYYGGILEIHVPKSETPIKIKNQRIIVY